MPYGKRILATVGALGLLTSCGSIAERVGVPAPGKAPGAQGGAAREAIRFGLLETTPLCPPRCVTATLNSSGIDNGNKTVVITMVDGNPDQASVIYVQGPRDPEDVWFGGTCSGEATTVTIDETATPPTLQLTTTVHDYVNQAEMAFSASFVGYESLPPFGTVTITVDGSSFTGEGAANITPGLCENLCPPE